MVKRVKKEKIGEKKVKEIKNHRRKGTGYTEKEKEVNKETKD